MVTRQPEDKPEREQDRLGSRVSEMLTEKPTTAFVLSLVGGVIVLLVGFFVMVIRRTRLVLGETGLLGGATGLLGVTWGISMIAGAVMLYFRPQQHKTWSIMVIVFSLLSWVGSVGGLFIGFILGLLGGILGIIWKPSVAKPTLTSPSSQTTRTCPACSTTIYTDAKYCPRCGKELS